MNNKFLFSQFAKSIFFTIAILVLHIILVTAQSNPCSSNSKFEASQGYCNSGQSIFVKGANSTFLNCPNCAFTHKWTVSSTIGSPIVASGLTACIPVPSPNTWYNISYTIIGTTTTPSGKKVITETAQCDFFVSDADRDKVNYTSGLPDNTITQIINTDKPVGTIKGVNEVSLTGASTYNIPIDLPSGTAGMTPSIIIGYNSSIGNGLIGYGWNLGVSSIIARVQTDLYNDDKVSSPSLSSNDAFAIDGNRLILMSGTYGTAGSTYQTKNENFSRITLNSFADFTVDTKDGKQMEYENNDGIIWNLTKVKDLNGNYVKYFYSVSANNETTLTGIDYTGNESIAMLPYNKVRFEYANRNDANIAYTAGIPTLDNGLLTKMTVFAEGQAIRTYTFVYMFDGIHSYLREMKVADAENKVLNSTFFKYGDYNDALIQNSVENLTTSTSNYSSNLISSGDFNGDGITDVLLGEYDNGTKKGNYSKFKALIKDVGNYKFKAGTSVVLPIDNTIVYKYREGREQLNFMSQDFNGDSWDDVPVLNIEKEIINAKTIRYIKSVDIYSSKGDGNFAAAQVNLPNTYKYTYYYNSKVIFLYC